MCFTLGRTGKKRMERASAERKGEKRKSFHGRGGSEWEAPRRGKVSLISREKEEKEIYASTTARGFLLLCLILYGTKTATNALKREVERTTERKKRSRLSRWEKKKKA